MVCKVFGGEYRPGTRDGFHRLVVERSLPMLERRKIAVLGYGASLQEDSSYYLIRGYPSLEERQRQEDAFYGSSEWKEGPRAAILAPIVHYTTMIMPADSVVALASKITAMNFTSMFRTDSAMLKQDAKRHERIIARDFVCVESDGHVVGREEYLKGWETAYQRSGYTSFEYTDEVIRIFGNTALVRSKTVYTKMAEGKEVKGLRGGV